MELHHLPFLIPLFFGFIWLEHQLTRHEHPVYSFDNTVLNLCCGVMERTIDLFYYAAMYFFFDWLYRSFALFDIRTDLWWNWVLAAVLLDFMYYWYHRAGHEINVFWAAHITHHQSEEFNLSVSFRNSNIPMIYKTLFWMPVPLLGFTPEIVIAGITAAGVWQFFIHTTVIGRLGFLEKIMVTPSAHRVHHGSNEQYLDKNYGAMLIVWDRLFGTYAAENEPVKYGLTKSFTGSQPLRAWFHYWSDLLRASRRAKGVFAKIKIWTDRPGTVPETGKTPHGTADLLLPKTCVLPYVAVQIAVLSLSLTLLLAGHEFLSVVFKLLAGAWMIASAMCICLLLERTDRGLKVELLRQACTAGLIFSLPGLPVVLALLPAGFAVWLWFATAKSQMKTN